MPPLLFPLACQATARFAPALRWFCASWLLTCLLAFAAWEGVRAQEQAYRLALDGRPQAGKYIALSELRSGRYAFQASGSGAPASQQLSGRAVLFAPTGRRLAAWPLRQWPKLRTGPKAEPKPGQILKIRLRKKGKKQVLFQKSYRIIR